MYSIHKYAYINGINVYQLYIQLAKLSTTLFFLVVQCPSLSITNGDVVFTNGMSYKDRSVYTCDEGYSLNRHPVRMCQADMTWEGAVTPTCSGEF